MTSVGYCMLRVVFHWKLEDDLLLMGQCSGRLFGIQIMPEISEQFGEHWRQVAWQRQDDAGVERPRMRGPQAGYGTLAFRCLVI